jgi:hypothetical protein
VVLYRHAPTIHSNLGQFVVDLTQWFNDWVVKVESRTTPDPFSSCEPDTRHAILGIVRKELTQLSKRVDVVLPMAAQRSDAATRSTSAGILSAIARRYDGPGDLSAEGRRHSNGETPQSTAGANARSCRHP